LNKPFASILALTLLAVLTACGREHRRKRPELTTPYTAVLLDNGQVYYGKLANAGSEFPELTDVYNIQSQVNQDTKAASNVLVRRGNEWHAPDRMNQRHIILIELVGTNSKVAQLIEADKNKHQRYRTASDKGRLRSHCEGRGDRSKMLPMAATPRTDLVSLTLNG
jgi:hypothetical protein